VAAAVLLRLAMICTQAPKASAAFSVVLEMMQPRVCCEQTSNDFEILPETVVW